ncbi:MAG: HlyC/CorC family transporter [Alphaproteobacteria bacterium]|nr:HlyC/CorC family transporter [Alphaproteobacteria bacterium]
MKDWQSYFPFLFKKKEGDGSLRETIEELIEEEEIEDTSLAPDEREMLTNILNLRDLTAKDLMIPRAEIIGVSHDSSLEQVITVFKSSQVMRLPVYRQTLDDILGYIHLRDLIDSTPNNFKIQDHLHKIDYISPSMRILDLLLKMRLTGEKMAIVVDEHGGVDGLVTLNDLVEEIVGDIQDVAQMTTPTHFFRRPDGVVVVNGRMDIEELEEKVGTIRTEVEKEEEIDTIGGLILHLTDRIPQRGELIAHPSGIEFEIIEADSRRIKRLGIHGLPDNPS